MSAQISRADSVFLQTGESIETFESISILDPNRAAFLSAVLPGLGQAYNNQYWKIPLIYGGGVIFAHYINYNHRIYEELKSALIAEADGDPNTINPYSDRFLQTSLKRNRDVFRRNRDFLIILGLTYYLLNVVDAHVSAHLQEFEINDKLSMQIRPTIERTPLFSHAFGVSVSISIK